ncbi:MAG: hypothetical protein MUC48_23025 [Leptolyngbya sp. Prado105]|jgi:hypothetical protein|nr:hypothetical protein [Leptolyngbya sp. Prado105]
MARTFQRDFEWLDDMEPEELEEEIGILIEDYPDVFSTQEQALPIIEQFEMYMQNCPLESAYLASYYLREIEHNLTQLLDTLQRNEHKLLSNLLCPDGSRNSPQQFNPHLLSPTVTGNFSNFSLLSSQIIQAGATLLRDIPPERIFDVPEPWQDSNQGMCWDDEAATFFGYWRDLYLEAAERQDVMLIGVS